MLRSGEFGGQIGSARHLLEQFHRLRRRVARRTILHEVTGALVAGVHGARHTAAPLYAAGADRVPADYDLACFIAMKDHHCIAYVRIGLNSFAACNDGHTSHAALPCSLTTVTAVGRFSVRPLPQFPRMCPQFWKDHTRVTLHGIHPRIRDLQVSMISSLNDLVY